MSTVYFVDFNGRKDDSTMHKMERLCNASGLQQVIAPDDLTAVKLHFGELGNTRMLRPQFAKVMVRLIKEAGGQPFLTDCNTLFYRERFEGVRHLQTAAFNGFDQLGIGAPVIIADGLKGLDYRSVKAGPTLPEARIGAAIYEADALVVLTHFKGHDDVGFGGIIKNLGMGAIARSGKQIIHSHLKANIDKTLCNFCGQCLGACSQNAIYQDNTGYNILPDRCNQCGHCLVLCPQRAIPVQWERDDTEMQKKLVESCQAVLKNKTDKAFFVSFLVDITAYCDCRSWSPLPIINDIGILAGTDPLSIEQASYDLVSQEIVQNRAGKDLRDFTGVDGSFMLQYAEETGLGSREYQLVRV